MLNVFLQFLQDKTPYSKGEQTVCLGLDGKTRISDKFMTSYLTPPLPASEKPPATPAVPQIPQQPNQSNVPEIPPRGWVVSQNLLSKSSMFQDKDIEINIIANAIACIEEYRFPLQTEKHDGITRAISLLYILKAHAVKPGCKMLVLDALLTKGSTGTYSSTERSYLVKMLWNAFSESDKTFIHTTAKAYWQGHGVDFQETQQESLPT